MAYIHESCPCLVCVSNLTQVSNDFEHITIQLAIMAIVDTALSWLFMKITKRKWLECILFIKITFVIPDEQRFSQSLRGLEKNGYKVTITISMKSKLAIMQYCNIYNIYIYGFTCAGDFYCKRISHVCEADPALACCRYIHIRCLKFYSENYKPGAYIGTDAVSVTISNFQF